MFGLTVEVYFLLILTNFSSLENEQRKRQKKDVLKPGIREFLTRDR